MSNLKEQNYADIHSFQKSSNYQEIAKQTDNALFTFGKAKFHQILYISQTCPLHRGKGRKRKHDGDQRYHQHTACQSFVLPNDDFSQQCNHIEGDDGINTIQLNYDYLSKHIRK